MNKKIRIYRFIGACGNLFGLSVILALSMYVVINAENNKIKLDKKEHKIKQLEKENDQLRVLNKIGARVCLPANTIRNN